MNRYATLAAAVLCTLTLGLPAVAANKAPAKKEPVLADLNPEQMENASRVLTGKIECEFSQSVDVEPLAAKQGYFQVAFKGKKYTLAPEATTTGAVRLENKKDGIVWIQIANKSMLMNSKAGQRMADNCVHPSQKS